MKKIMLIIAGLALMGQGCAWLDFGGTSVQTDTEADIRVDEAREMEPVDVTPDSDDTDEEVKPEVDTGASATVTASASIIDFSFQPNVIRIRQGGKILFTNRDSIGHTVTADQGGTFDSGLLLQGQSFTLDTALLAKGTYTFHCTPHPQMKGTVLVE
jgi:plastocyanin